MKEKTWCAYFAAIGVYGFFQLYIWFRSKDTPEEEKRKMLNIFDPDGDILELWELIKANKKEGI